MGKTLFIGALLGLGLALARAAEPPRTELTVEAEGFADAKGLAALWVYDSLGNLVKGPPRYSLTAGINSGSARFRLRDFPSGAWAFLVFQDRNKNNEIDHGWNRFPTEPMGYSRGFVPGISAGMPTFGKAAVPVRSPADTIRVTVAEVNLKSFFRGKSQ